MREYEEAALAIAGRLGDDAIWHAGRCNWVGPTSETRRGASAVAYRSLGPDLYGGTAGIGLVLAEIATVIGDAGSRRTGIAALRHALDRAGDIAPDAAGGLYTGRVGVAVAAIRSGLLLDQPELAEGGQTLLRGAVSHALDARPDDLVAGRAGAVVGLLIAASAMPSPELTARAADVGDALVQDVATRERPAWQNGTGRPTPTGLSHGAAGIAHALLELWAATGLARHRNAGERAIAQEQAHFDPLARNWPDGRNGRGGTGSTVSFVSWCHGAPGIGLARTRAWRLTGDLARRAEAGGALEVTARWTRAAVAASRGSYCLCHGLGGNAEILRDCGDTTGPRAGELRALAREVARTGLSEYHATGREWPCGAPGGVSPGLMTGVAGIARFYLRAARPTLPSLLLPSPSERWGPGEGSGLA
jgi:lantibiotic modifying enzyme